MVDDTTGTTTRVVFETLKAWIEKYGIPLALYVDLKNVYIGHKELSHLQRACDKLGIRIIKAYSPQAKGRVERNHKVYKQKLMFCIINSKHGEIKFTVCEKRAFQPL
ncbi:MAG: hypothetical protein QG556_584 [Pseudomonadota bacterium]|nr:hypothetical protein [Pseudomonadota bacterium]